MTLPFPIRQSHVFHSTFCCWPSALHAWPSQHGVQQKKNHPPGSASPRQVAQSFSQASVSSCPSWVNIKRTRVEGENMRRWWQVFTSGCPAGCLCHRQVSQSQETHYCCQTLPNIISRRILFGWIWSINSDLRSCSKIRQQKTLKSDLGEHSHHWLHSFLLMTCFVICHQISMTRPKEKKKSRKWE